MPTIEISPLRVLTPLMLLVMCHCGPQRPALPESFTVDPTPAWGDSKGNAALGKSLAMKYCTPCHQVEGQGKFLKGAPPFVQTANRADIDAAWLRRWITSPQREKPGTLMPDLGLSESEVEHCIAFLYQLRN